MKLESKTKKVVSWILAIFIGVIIVKIFFWILGVAIASLFIAAKVVIFVLILAFIATPLYLLLSRKLFK